MSFGFPEKIKSDLAADQVSSLPEIVWNYEATSETLKPSVLMDRVFRVWATAQKHGFKLHDAMYRGQPLSASEAASLNLWIDSGASLPASKGIDSKLINSFATRCQNSLDRLLIALIPSTFP